MRDSICFVLSLITIFFAIITGQEILWYEALIMLVLYAGYIVLMRFNAKLMAIMGRVCK